MPIEIITSDAIGPLRHGFFTRKGGVSSGIYTGLNCASGSSDQRDAVETNRALVAQAMGVARDNLINVYQVHSADVVPVTEPFATDDRPHADAIVTATPGLALAILTADCQPVLFSDPGAGVIGAAHAGWRGALNGVLENTLQAMVSLGADIGAINVAIGPCISQSSYEVGPEFFDDFMADDESAQRFFANGEGDRMLFDLPAYSLNRLRVAGVNHAEWTRHCTYSDADRFYSYRRATHLGEPDYGRLISAISL